MNRLAASALLLGACSASPHAAAPAPQPHVCPAQAASPSSQDEIAALGGCARLPALAIRTAAPLDLAPLRELTEISGDLVIGPSVAIEAIHLDSLRAVTGEIRIISNTALHGLYLPALEHAGAVTIEGNLDLAAFTAPRLDTVERAVSIRDNHDLAFVELAALAHVNDVHIEGCPELAEDVITDLQARSHRD
jgi:hypothetical protein